LRKFKENFASTFKKGLRSVFCAVLRVFSREFASFFVGEFAVDSGQ